MDMLKRFFPQKYYKSVYDISIKQLHDKNIKGIIFDIDNTLAPFDIKYPDQNIKDFFIMLQKEGFKVSLVSNNKGNRVEVFNSQLNFPAVSRAGDRQVYNCFCRRSIVYGCMGGKSYGCIFYIGKTDIRERRMVSEIKKRLRENGFKSIL
jgi:hypothetical protein